MVLRPYIIYYLYILHMCVCVFVCFIYFFLCIYYVTMWVWVPTTVIGHTKLILEHVSFFPYFIPISSLTTYIITWYILHTYICIFFYILHSIRIYYSHLACHASKQIMTKILVTVVYHIILNGVLLFSVYQHILFVLENSDTVYELSSHGFEKISRFVMKLLWRTDQECIIIILCPLKSIYSHILMLTALVLNSFYYS